MMSSESSNTKTLKRKMAHLAIPNEASYKKTRETKRLIT